MPESLKLEGQGSSFDGADWIGINWSQMLARRERQIRQLHFYRDLDLANQTVAPIVDPSYERPLGLISKLRVENIRSLAGSHDIPLAPLTLIYGPNAAGKSTVLKSLRLFRDLLESGRKDALGPWTNQLESGHLADMMTQQTRFADPVERAAFEDGSSKMLQARSQLELGIDFRTRQGVTARAELACVTEGQMHVPWHSSSLGVVDTHEPHRKEFSWSAPSSSSPWTFGEETYPQYEVSENGTARGVRVFDAYLFAHPNQELQKDLFALMQLMHYLGPHRGSPVDGYEPFRSPFRDHLQKLFRADPLSHIIEDRLLNEFGRFEAINQMLSQLEIPYEFVPTFTSGELLQPEDPRYLKDLSRKWILRDLRSQASVKLNQVGYGISQLLPVIDVCIHSRQQLICIEEPELHLHPRLQAKLGNLLATTAVTFGNQVIVETHSESILLRVRRLIRAGKLLPGEVAVLYVDNDSDGSTVQRLRLGEHGELLDSWPTGFFDDSLSDVLGATK